ncbi:NADPH-dependent FMN reductase [Methanoculleus bourgensis MS2]|jgi:multimeric flavodoxin WrbA|uniref:NADPH-dependent FMN reductase n=1 Tax=Methanoculleus bourgensis (strain ATCC 43281 / DSM 3045 / OCM 15 / MS2) TaxID=1201294 RepID=I7KCL7_METBM|nr:flavodoxin family protein [Methanoculleus bourgensis]CCJ36106.1 NADPH-dependent FMN reductase [Methanoculleus bourgensis MS2]
MKVLGINGSPRGERSATLQLIAAVLEDAKEKGAEVDVVNLIDLDIRFRNACSACFQEGRCVEEDDFPELYTKIKAADGLVLGSPVYIDLITGQMKLLIDRMADGIQCQALSGKYGCSVSTSGDHAEQAVVTYLNHFLQMLGATPVGGVGVAIGRDQNALTRAEEDARELGKTLAEAILTQRRYPDIEAFHQRFQEKFKAVITGAKPEWPGDYEHWVDQVWVW